MINAAKKIAEAGSRMDKLARAVADQVTLHVSVTVVFPPLHFSETVSEWIILAGGRVNFELE